MVEQMQTAEFEVKLQKAMEQVKLILETEKCAVVPSQEHHSYEDKFSLVERCTQLAMASQVNCLEQLGLDKEKLRQAKAWAETSQVSVRFWASEQCSFLRDETREVEDPRKTVNEISVAGMNLGLTSKTVTKVTEFIWNFEVTYKLEVFRGVGAEAEDKLCLQHAERSCELKTRSKATPQPESKVPALCQEAPLNFLLKHMESERPCFRVDRDSQKTKTPRRNKEVDEAAKHYKVLGSFMHHVVRYLQALSQKGASPITSSLSAETVLVPALPLFVSGPQSKAAPNSSIALLDTEAAEPGPVISPGDSNRLLEEEMRSLEARRQSLAEEMPGDGLFRLADAELAMTLQHCKDVTQQWHESMSYVESLLRAQLAAAIGKEVSVQDFSDYMRFHYRKLFQDSYMPSPFSFAVRRSELHSPEGTLSIEDKQQPVCSMCCSGWAESMSFDLNASTRVSFAGEVHLHAWLAHQFSGQSGLQLSLVSRARQFSSFLVLVGRISSATQFDPQFAALVQNKDELEIPLELSTIPTPKEFKDAIESLSPEQKAFAKAFRAMQLESTLFGIVVVQVKPQLEQLLKLPVDSLTKEIKLTQDLMQLFIKYQIPSDLLAFSEELVIGEATAAQKLDIVKAQVAQMNAMIAEEKKQELEERRKQEEFKRMEALRVAEETARAERMKQEELRCLDQLEKEHFVPQSIMIGASTPKRRSAAGFAGGMMKSMGSAINSAFSSRERCAAPAPRRAMSCASEAPVLSGSISAAAPAPCVAPTSHACGGAASAATALKPKVTKPMVDVRAPVTEETSGRDYTQVPKQLDEEFEKLTSSVRPTIITPQNSWRKRSQAALLAAAKSETLEKEEQKREKDAAFDLLDAITKSGALPLSHASMHIVVAATHCFDKTVTETVIQENLNPIEKVECSSLIMASTVHQQPVPAMIKESCHARIQASLPQLWQIEN